MSRSITQDEYVAVLGRIYGFMSPLEAVLNRSLRDFDLGRPFSELMRSPDMEKDLAYFGRTDDYLKKLPRAQLPGFLDMPSALAMMYLLEGSRMGGIVIARSLEDCMGLSPECGMSYLTSYGKDPHLIKDEFESRLVSWISSTGKEAEVIAGAREGFSALNAWMDAMEPCR